MNFIQIWLVCIIAVKELTCKTITTNRAYVANRRQQDLIEGSMDPSVEPCEDFYQYACGKWENLYPEAGDKFHETVTLLEYKRNMEMVRTFSRINLQSQPKFVNMAFELFVSCYNLDDFKTVYYLNLLKETEDMKFPPLGRSKPRQKPEKYDWLVMLAKMRIYGMNGILTYEHVVQSDVDPSKYIMYLSKPVIGEQFTPLTKDNLEAVIEFFGESANTLKLWREIEAFELDLKNLSDRYTYQEIFDEWTLEKVKDIPAPWIQNYIKILLNQTELNPNMEVYLKNVWYLKAIDKFVKEYSQRFLCQYLEIRFLLHLLQQGPSTFAGDCVAFTTKFMPMAMNWLYEQQQPDLQQEFPKVIELHDDIRKIFNKSLLQNDNGFNETVVNHLLAKVNTMKLKLNNIPRKNTVQTLEKFYDKLEINVNDFYANHLQLLKFNFLNIHNTVISNATQQMDYFLQDTSLAPSLSLNYVIRFNTVVVPLLMLQKPIYQPNSDNVYKHSSFAFLLALSMFHALDSDSLEFDNKGVRVSQPYNDILTNPLFKDKIVNCFLETNPLQRENKIADISALSYAYQLFNDSTPDDIDVSQRKLFFLNFAQYFCGTSNSEDFVYRTDTSDRERVMDALTRFPEFSKVFQCNSSHRMYPQPTLCDIGGY